MQTGDIMGLNNVSSSTAAAHKHTLKQKERLHRHYTPRYVAVEGSGC